MSDLVGNPEDRFSRVVALMIASHDLYLLFSVTVGLVVSR